MYTIKSSSFSLTHQAQNDLRGAGESPFTLIKPH